MAGLSQNWDPFGQQTNGEQDKVQPDTGDVLCNLVGQMQLLAALHWLNKLEILACIPPFEAVPIQDIADMAGVSESQLTRIARLTATAGFLYEPEPGLVAHTALSTQFLTKPALVDAVTFIGDTAFPAALQMVNATRSQTQTQTLDLNQSLSAYNYASQSPSTFAINCVQHPKLKRQATAFQRLVLHNGFPSETGIADILTPFLHGDGDGQGNCTVVLVNCPTGVVARILAHRHSDIHFVAQLITSENNKTLSTEDLSQQHSGNLTLQDCTPGSPQAVKNAQLYMVQLPLPTLLSSLADVRTNITSTLRAHVEVLRSNPRARLVLVAQGMLRTDAGDDKGQAAACMYDVCLMQMSNGNTAMSLDQMDQIFRSLSDPGGKLVVLERKIIGHLSTVVMELGWNTT